MQYLQVGGWRKASAHPDSPRVIEKRLAKGWIERKPGPADRVLYRTTEKGTTAKKTRIP
jgi:DNA-binding MarR family transcriptional regulator